MARKAALLLPCVPFPVGGALWPAPTALGGAVSLCEPWRAARASSRSRPTAALWPCLTRPQGLRSALAGRACPARLPAPCPAVRLRWTEGPWPWGWSRSPGGAHLFQNFRLLYLYSDVTVFCMRCWRSRRGCLPRARGLTINTLERRGCCSCCPGAGAGAGPWAPVLALSTSKGKGVGLAVGTQALVGASPS